MKRTSNRLAAILFFAFVSLTGHAFASESCTGFVFSVIENNDSRIIPHPTDKHFTQGLEFTLLWPDQDTPMIFKPLDWLPRWGIHDPVNNYGFSFGQNIYTPVDLTQTSIIETDRPYAGWLYLGYTRNIRGTTASGIPLQDHLNIQMGVIGPWALGDQAQSWWHRLIGVDVAQGWANQLHNEFGFLLQANRRWLVWQNDASEILTFQCIPDLTINLGNVETSARAGFTIRIGHNIPDDFGKVYKTVWGGYFFAAAGANAVAYSAFIDGNTSGYGTDITREPFVFDGRLGFVLVLHRCEFTYAYTIHSDQFKNQGKPDSIGTLAFTYRF
jgi:lipid A 3-O-deacylase